MSKTVEFLKGIKGIGLHKAKLIADRFDQTEDLRQATLKDWCRVLGIGPVAINAVRDKLGLPRICK